MIFEDFAAIASIAFGIGALIGYACGRGVRRPE